MAKEEGGVRRVALTIAAIGVVFGDIGTSPLYALRECFSPIHGIPVERDNIIGIVSLLIWSLSLVVCVKYLGMVVRADNRGEGGILALVALVSRHLPKGSARRTAFVSVLGIVGVALLYSDGMITPALTVLASIEGLKVVSPDFVPYIIPISLALLLLLFLIQSKGTAKIGRVFGPVLALWFVTIGVMGLAAIIAMPEILVALNPFEAISFVARNGALSFGVLGAVFLSMTGAEVLYADLGHFGRSPIRRGWFSLVYPALLLNYVGQGAFLLAHPNQVDNLFFRLVPDWAMYPLLALATLASSIASQAVISGTFSLARQSVQLGFWPRIQIKHTSDETVGQVYAPLVNWILLVGTIGLVLGFKSSDALTNAYGIAVSAMMLMTTCLMVVLARKATHLSPWLVFPVGLFFLLLDSAFFLSNAMKIVSGGWIVVAFAIALFILMKTWMDGRKLFAEKAQAYRLAPQAFADSLALSPPHRVSGTAVYLTADPQGTPKALLHNLKHNKVLHELTLILSVQTVDEPRVESSNRSIISGPYGGIWYVALRFGFSESPDVPAALAKVEVPGFDHDPMKTTYFIGREDLIRAKRSTMSRGRLSLFIFLFNNALSPTHFFRLPPDRVVEIGSQTEL
jgi:K+ transporter